MLTKRCRRLSTSHHLSAGEPLSENKEINAHQKEHLSSMFQCASTTLGHMPFMLGEKFSILDAYLYALHNSCSYAGIDVSMFPVINSHAARVTSIPEVRQAHAAMAAAR